MSEDIIKTYHVKVTCDSSGDATAYVNNVACLLYGINIVKGGTSIANTSDVTISAVGNFPQTIITLTDLDVTSTSKIYYPRVDTCGAAGAALNMNQTLVPVSGAIKIVIAQGGALGSADFYFAGG